MLPKSFPQYRLRLPVWPDFLIELFCLPWIFFLYYNYTKHQAIRAKSELCFVFPYFSLADLPWVLSVAIPRVKTSIAKQSPGLPRGGIHIRRCQISLFEQVKLLVFLTILFLIPHVFPYCFFIPVLANRSAKISHAPELWSQELFLNFCALREYLPSSDALDLSDNLGKRMVRCTLYKKMHMIPVSTYLQKSYVFKPKPD